MKKISSRLTQFIINNGYASNNDFDIYQYGFQMFMEVFICFIMSLFIAICNNMFVEYTIFSLIFISLRSFTGGIHFNNFTLCFFISTLVQIAFFYIAKTHVISIEYSWIITIVCSFLIYKIGPTENADETMSNTEKKYFKRKVLKILTAILVFSAVTTVIAKDRFLSVSAYTLLFVFVSKLLVIIKQIGDMKRSL